MMFVVVLLGCQDKEHTRLTVSNGKSSHSYRGSRAQTKDYKLPASPGVLCIKDCTSQLMVLLKAHNCVGQGCSLVASTLHPPHIAQPSYQCPLPHTPIPSLTKKLYPLKSKLYSPKFAKRFSYIVGDLSSLLCKYL